MRRAAIYARVSTSRQAEHDLSLPDQIAQCRAWCEKHGYDVAQVFTEPGASALDEDRPVFQEMIYTAKRSDHPFDVVLVHSLSRFSRDSMHSELYIRELRKAGVQLVSITQEVAQDGSGEFLRKMLNLFDEHSSRENARHVHRAMLENARQGFWNGSVPPYGYRTQTAERRGTKDKKVLVVDEAEARVVRLIFELATGQDGRPMGVKAIASCLNERGITRRGYKFSTGSVHVILTCETYAGKHHFNRRDSRTGRPRPPSEWVAISVPPVIAEETFNAAQALLKSRAPKVIAPRLVNTPTLLAGIARCGHCGGALKVGTGKSGRYRYYTCANRATKGEGACAGQRIPMNKLDDIVLGELADRILRPDRLMVLLEGYLKTAQQRDERQREEIRHLRQAHRDAEAGLTRLMELVEKGLMDASDPALRERLISLRFRRDELAREVAACAQRLANADPAITPGKVDRLAEVIREHLFHGAPELRQAYARLLINEVIVKGRVITITGSKAALARSATTDLEATPQGVLTFVRGWRAQQESNLRPQD